MAAFENASGFELSFNNGAIRNCFTMGISPSLRLSPHFSLEMEFYIYPNFREEYQYYYENSLPGNQSWRWGRSKNSAYNISLAAQYELKIKSLRAIVPYFTAGVGFLSRAQSLEDISYSGEGTHIDKNSRNDLHVAVGGGVKYRLSDKAGLRFDCRWISALAIYKEDGSSILPDFDTFGVRLTGGFYIKLEK
jgi:opacity protein-like surface antigen